MSGGNAHMSDKRERWAIHVVDEHGQTYIEVAGTMRVVGMIRGVEAAEAAIREHNAYGALLDAAKAVIADMHEFNRATGRDAHLLEYECRECRRDPLNKPGYRCAYHALRAVIASAEHTPEVTQ